MPALNPKGFLRDQVARKDSTCLQADAPRTTTKTKASTTRTTKTNKNEENEENEKTNNNSAAIATNDIRELVNNKGFHEASTNKRFVDAGVHRHIAERKQRGEGREKNDDGRDSAISVHPNRALLESRKNQPATTAQQRSRANLRASLSN